MSNVISFNSDTISMSNGQTDVLINVLVLSGSRLAETVDEKRLIVWLAEKDQSKVGMGTVGFDIGEMPWNADSLGESKAFLLNVIRGAENRLGWEKLDYLPNEELIFPVLKKLAELISVFSVEDITRGGLEEWLEAAEEFEPVRCGFPKCEKHGALISCFGCQICNN